MVRLAVTVEIRRGGRALELGRAEGVQRLIRSFRGQEPSIDPSAYVDPSAEVIGAVRLGPDASVWCGAVVRADINRIEIGPRSNVQDVSVLHVTGDHPVVIHEEVTLGHRVVVHGATVRSGALIGIGAVVLDGADVGEESLVAAGAVVTPGARIPPRALVRGVPARVVRPLTDDERARLREPAHGYVGYAAEYRAQGHAR